MGKKKVIILSLVLLSYFITAIDGSIVFTGLIKITEDLNLNYEELSWIQNAYLLSFGGFMLMSGGLGKAFGRKRIFNLSLIIFGIGSLGAGVAQSAGFMIASRFIQGTGSAMLAPTALALIMDYFEGQERVKAVAWYGSISGLGLCIGLIIGGAITDYASWRDGFLVNIPIISVMMFYSFRYLDGKPVSSAHFDIPGTILSISGIFCLLYAIDGAKNMTGWMVAGVILISLFVLVESKSRVPIMPLRLFSSPDRRNAYMARAVTIGAMMGFNFFTSEFLQTVFGMSPLMTGVAFLPMNIATFIGAIKVPSLVKKYGDKRVLASGLTLMLVGFFSLLFLGPDSRYLTGVGVPMLFVGLGIGLAMSPLTNLGISGVVNADAGAASALVNVAHQVGGAFGLSIMIAANSGVEDMTQRYHTGMIIAIVCITLALTITFSRFARRHLKTSRCSA